MNPEHHQSPGLASCLTLGFPCLSLPSAEHLGGPPLLPSLTQVLGSALHPTPAQPYTGLGICSPSPDLSNITQGWGSVLHPHTCPALHRAGLCSAFPHLPCLTQGWESALHPSCTHSTHPLSHLPIGFPRYLLLKVKSEPKAELSSFPKGCVYI